MSVHCQCHFGKLKYS